MEIILGQKLKCAITGFEGIATAKVSYLTGCDQVKLEGTASKSGEVQESWIDVNRVIVINEKPVKLPGEPKTDPGGPAISIPARHP